MSKRVTYNPDTPCTCTFSGPRPLEGESMCDNCRAWHAIYFPAFPGDSDWRLNHGAIDRNSWGIVPGKIKTRDIEKVSDLQLAAAEKRVLEAHHNLQYLKSIRSS